MQIIKFLQDNWALLRDHIWVFVTWAVLFAALGWGAGSMWYKERIEILKEKAQGQPLPNSHPNVMGLDFTYPPIGRHGPNILSNATHDIFTGDAVSMRAEIPARSKLQVVIKMETPSGPNKNGAWFYDVSKISNWVNRGYDQSAKLVSQRFDAEPGVADIELRFVETGNLKIEVFEGDSHAPSWQHVLRVQSR